MTDSKIINDPVFGFIKVPKGLLLNLVKHPSMQRLRRIKQLGLASMVYPGAQHTRFQHSLGAFHLMREAILSLTQKGVYIFDMEAEAISAAILMHDIGHGPFSHVLENTLIRGISHEDISLMIMERLNDEMNGSLTLAIRIFQNQYPKQFLHQLISSQLDVDRLDYLRRDSFFTGVSEGNIGSARIIKMMDVVDDNLVIEAKGIYSIENYLIARRLMYWQVYLHKTTVACESVLVNTLLRAKHLARQGKELFASPSLRYFLYNDVDRTSFEQHEEALHQFERLDDNDIICAIKAWMDCDDRLLSMLAADIINREPFRVEISDTPISEERIAEISSQLCSTFGVSAEEARYLYKVNTIQKDLYDMHDEQISILYNDGTQKNIAEASEILNAGQLSHKNCKYYLCYHRF